MEIIHSEMVTALAKSGETIVAELTGPEMHRLHMALGLSGESAELLEALLEDELDEENFLEEMGDLEFYYEGLRQGVVAAIPDFKVPESPESIPTASPESGIVLTILAGTILDLVKRNAIYRKELDSSNLANAMAGLRAAMTLLYKNEAFTQAQGLEANIKKLGKRYEGLRYSDSAAQDRADKSA